MFCGNLTCPERFPRKGICLYAEKKPLQTCADTEFCFYSKWHCGNLKDENNVRFEICAVLVSSVSVRDGAGSWECLEEHY